MLALNKKTDYGLIALCCLAAQPDGVRSARSIAQTYGMSLSLLMNVLKDMQRDGLVDSVRGSRGGYQLARPARQISLAQLVQSLQGAPRLVACLSENSGKTDTGHFCDLASHCPVQSPVRKVHLKLQDLFNNISLADLIDEKHDLPVATGV